MAKAKPKNPKRGEIYRAKATGKKVQITAYRGGRVFVADENGKKRDLAVSTLRKSYELYYAPEPSKPTKVKKAKPDAKSKAPLSKLKKVDRDVEILGPVLTELVRPVVLPVPPKTPVAERPSTVNTFLVLTGVMIGIIAAILILYAAGVNFTT